ncbi:MAG: NAD-dependent epimerase [Conexibacter sp.]|nr:NAD-dependent epimerase [Conexibacter sp.]
METAALGPDTELMRRTTSTAGQIKHYDFDRHGKDIIMKIFITGGSGYIGLATIAALRADGHEVVALSRSEGSDERLRAAGATPVRGTLTDRDVLRAAAARADGVIHLGADYSGDGAAVDRDAAAAMLQGVGSGPFVHTGGVWVYGDTNGVVDETAPLDPPAIVAWREDNEVAVLGATESGGHPVLVMPGLVYGDRLGLIETFFDAPARDGNHPYPYIDDGTNCWALVHRADIADLYVRALGAPAGSTYIGVGPGAPTGREVAEALAASAGRPGEVASISLEEARETMGPIADAFALDQQLTSAKAQAELGWTPRFTDPLAELARPPLAAARP